LFAFHNVTRIRAVFYVHWDTLGTSKTTAFTQFSGLGARGTLIENKKLYKITATPSPETAVKVAIFECPKGVPAAVKYAPNGRSNTDEILVLLCAINSKTAHTVFI
jgi:hypothetical protein